VVSIALRSLYTRTKGWATDIKSFVIEKNSFSRLNSNRDILRLPVYSVVAIPTELLGPTNSSSQKRSDVFGIND